MLRPQAALIGFDFITILFMIECFYILPSDCSVNKSAIRVNFAAAIPNGWQDFLLVTDSEILLVVIQRVEALRFRKKNKEAGFETHNTVPLFRNRTIFSLTNAVISG